jgi:uncharacterized membrane protein
MAQQMVLALFPNRADADRAVGRLQEMGFNPKDISVIVKGSDGETVTTTGSKVAEGTVTGATTGGIAGALAGLLAGVGAITIPGLGAILIGGPIAAALGLTGAAATAVSATVTGVLAGGLLGALVNLGVPEAEAKVYEEKLKAGSVLLAVPVTMDQEAQVLDIMRGNNVTQVNTINAAV